MAWVPRGAKIIDLGFPNILSREMTMLGYRVVNTEFDLNKQPENLANYHGHTATAFEVIEHLLDPYCVLQNIQTQYLLVTVPLKVWFRRLHWPADDEWEQHFHEFYPEQIRKLLTKTNWTIMQDECWRVPWESIGWRPALRMFWPSYYFAVCRKEVELILK